MVEVGNSTSTAIVANQTIPFEKVNFDTNNRIYFDKNTNSIVITKVGKYEINGSFIFSSGANATINITAYANGVPIPFDIATFNGVANIPHTFTLPSKVISVIPSSSGDVVKITFSSSVDGTLTNALASVKYIE